VGSTEIKIMGAFLVSDDLDFLNKELSSADFTVQIFLIVGTIPFLSLALSVSSMLQVL